MRTLRSVLPTVVVALLAPAVALAQPDARQAPPPLGDIGKPGDRLFVTDPTGVEIEGRLLRVSPDELVLLVGGEERAFQIDRIGRIEKRDSLWNGILIGMVPGAWIGAAATGFECHDCGREIATGAIVGGVVGASLGALIDADAKGYSSVYGPSLGSPNARRVPEPVMSIEDLWLRVRRGDRIDVVTLDGRKIRGTFVQVSEAAVTLDVGGERREIPASGVGRVTRPGNRFRQGAAWGAVIMAAIGAVGGSTGCDTGSCAVLLPVYLGMQGALWGTAIGALIPRHAVVYESAVSAELRLSPMLGPGRVGIVFSAKF